MKFLGYRQVPNKLHLIISFKMFQDTLKFKGYYQPSIEQWMLNQKEDLDYNPQKFSPSSGTLLVQFYDRRQGRSIWQGYATTHYGNIDFNNNRQLKNAVTSILDKYRSGLKAFWTALCNKKTSKKVKRGLPFLKNSHTFAVLNFRS